MRLPHVERKARTLDISNTHRYTKPELIKIIQKAEGSAVCFGTAGRNCVQTSCCWRMDCLRK